MNTNDVINVVNEPINNSKEKKNIFPIILVIILLIGLIIVGIRHSKEQKELRGKEFVSLLTRDQYIVEMFKKDDTALKYGETNYTITSYDDNGEPAMLSANVLSQDEILDVKVFGTESDEKIVLLEFIKEDNTFALNLPDLYEKFIAVTSENGVEVASKFGYDYLILDDNNTPTKVKEDVKSVVPRYELIIANAIGKYVKVKNNKEVTINNEVHNVQIYEVKLDVKAFGNIYRAILNELRNDNETLAILSATTSVVSNDSTEKAYQELKDTVESQYLALSFVGFIDESENEDLIDIRLYVENGKTIKTELIIPDYTYDASISLETTRNGNKDFIRYCVDEGLEEASIIYNADRLGNIYNGELKIYTSDNEESMIKLSIEKLNMPTRNVRKIEDINHILLDNATDEELDIVCQKVFGMPLEEFRKSKEDNDKYESYLRVRDKK